MSNRSYLVGLYIGLAALAVGCLFLFGSFFAHANNNQPKLSHREMNAFIADYNFATKHQAGFKINESVPQQYFNVPNSKNNDNHHQENHSHRTPDESQ
ncbi:hypothetical protein [Lactobacillus sp. Sy-1]|uniref:hypothetical protein n=1 Tax=Lactobacillus sp. Sy-1 TaxID=2109645 RepID=UPI001C5BA13A|nr:hypothetical protein [Lactobacillus sp. Sy-1]MBW1606041.1 hypothetical protein [Lactobacillus sp. Sy-1]